MTSTDSTADGYTGGQTLLAPAFIATDQKLAEMIERFAAAVAHVERTVNQLVAGAPAAGRLTRTPAVASPDGERGRA